MPLALSVHSQSAMLTRLSLYTSSGWFRKVSGSFVKMTGSVLEHPQPDVARRAEQPTGLASVVVVVDNEVRGLLRSELTDSATPSLDDIESVELLFGDVVVPETLTVTTELVVAVVHLGYLDGAVRTGWSFSGEFTTDHARLRLDGSLTTTTHARNLSGFGES